MEPTAFVFALHMVAAVAFLDRPAALRTILGVVQEPLAVLDFIAAHLLLQPLLDLLASGGLMLLL